MDAYRLDSLSNMKQPSVSYVTEIGCFFYSYMTVMMCMSVAMLFDFPGLLR